MRVVDLCPGNKVWSWTYKQYFWFKGFYNDKFLFVDKDCNIVSINGLELLTLQKIKEK